MNDLRACPFCGCKIIFIKHEHDDMFQWLAAECVRCLGRAVTDTYHLDEEFPEEKALRELKKLWNGGGI